MFYAVGDSCKITLRALPFTGRCGSLIVHDINCPCEYDSSTLLNFFLSFSQPSSPFSHAVSCGFGGSACHS